MFCIPYSDDIYFRYTEGEHTWDLPFTKTMAMALAQDVATDLGSGAVFDIQILPYCPVKHLFKIVNGKKIMIDQAPSSTYIVDEGGNPIGSIFWCFSSQFSFEIPYTIQVPNTPRAFKEQAICDKYRLCSPNMSSFFDFSPSKNNGVEVIEVDCYYKPYNPYIHLNPRFKELYALDYIDYEVRGLDLSGNFSLTQVNDAWTTYQLQNKNFENSFNRQQQQLETMRKYERIEQIAGATIGAINAGVQTGMMTGNVYAGLGAGVASGVGGAIDVAISEAKHKSQLEYNEAMHNYSLDNIKALPQSITKIDTLSPNNSLVPYMEYYTCTDIEREAIRNNLYYGGMTVGRIGSLIDFKQNELSFMKAQLVRIEGLEEDYHFADIITTELKLGVFI